MTLFALCIAHSSISRTMTSEWTDVRHCRHDCVSATSRFQRLLPFIWLTVSQRTDTLPIVRGAAPSNSGVKLPRPGFGPAAELPTVSPASRRHGGCSSPLAARQFIGGNRRAALP
jgi:hypothetical protein